MIRAPITPTQVVFIDFRAQCMEYLCPRASKQPKVGKISIF